MDRILDMAMTNEDERAKVRKARQASGELPEVAIVLMCERAGVEVRWSSASMEDKLTDARAFVPLWVAPFFEATVARSHQQRRVLMRASTDPEWRNAGLTVWRLDGLDALAKWCDGHRLQ